MLVLETNKWLWDWSSGPVAREGGSRAFQRPDRACLLAGWRELVLWRFAIQSRVSLWCVLSQYLPCVLLWVAEVHVQAEHAVQCGLIHHLSWLSTWLCKTTETHFEATDGLTCFYLGCVGVPVLMHQSIVDSFCLLLFCLELGNSIWVWEVKIAVVAFKKILKKCQYENGVRAFHYIYSVHFSERHLKINENNEVQNNTVSLPEMAMCYCIYSCF